MTEQHTQLTPPPADPEIVFDGRTADRRLPGTDDWHITRRTLAGGLSDGVDVLEVCNGPMTLWLLPTRGMGVWKAAYHGLPIGWESPVRQPVHPRHVQLPARNGLGWLDGFNELLCRCGLAFNGPPGIDEEAASPVESQLTLHGRIANIPAHTVEAGFDIETGTIRVRGVIDECTMFGPQLRMHSTFSTQAGSGAFTIIDEVTNLGSAATELQLLYHTNIGPPFLEAGSTVHAPCRAVCPRDGRAAEDIETFDTCLGPTPGYAEQVYFYDPLADEQGRTPVLLKNAAGDLGLSLTFDRSALPCLSVWKCTQPEADGYVTGLEPGTGYPNFKSFERRQGRVVRLEPGSTFTTTLTLAVHDSAESVEEVTARIARLQATGQPVVHRTPMVPFAPG